MKTALICGISGQDGAYLARLLLNKGYAVWGSSRDATTSSFHNLTTLGIRDRVKTLSMALTDFRSVLNAIVRSNPDEIYNLSGQSSVGLSFEQPAETLESIATGTLNVLEAMRFLERPIRFYNAGSSETFGDTDGKGATELTLLRPCSPYAVAKATAYWLVSNYRSAYGIAAATGILFNHESSLRPSRFVTRKVIDAAIDIAAGSSRRLTLGNLSVIRDWGLSEEYVDAMWRMLQLEQPQDFVIATGQAFTLENFVASAFEQCGLDWRAHVDIDPDLFRSSELPYSQGDASKAEKLLGWRARSNMHDVIRIIIEELRRCRS